MKIYFSDNDEALTLYQHFYYISVHDVTVYEFNYRCKSQLIWTEKIIFL